MCEPELTIVDVGHGNATVLRDGEEVVVFDGGPGSYLLEFIVREGIDRIDTVLISHADDDHIRGIVALLGAEEVTVGRVRCNTDSSKRSKIWDHLLWELDNAECKFEPSIVADDDDNPHSTSNVVVEVLAPSSYLAGKGPGSEDRQGRQITTNGISAVFRVHLGENVRVLLAGDVDHVGLMNMVERLTEHDKDCSANVLVFPHHGGGAGSGDPATLAREICEHVKPEVVAFSIGRTGRGANPRPEVVKAVQEACAPRVVCTQLSQHCATALPAKAPSHLLDAYARGKRTRCCCGGTLKLKRDSVKPLAKAHQAFISKWAPTALCQRLT